MITQDYIDLITSEHADKPNFTSTVSLSVQPFVDLMETLNAVPSSFDLDLAIGNQLDVIGEWAGRSRLISTPLVGVYFSWRDTVDTGWRSGVWKGVFDPISGLTRLPDDSYRRLLRAKIAANSWDGTIPGAYTAWENIFTNSSIIIQDNQDMSMDIGIVGETLSIVDKQLLIGGYIPLKPEGVRINYYALAPTETSKLFSWRTAESSTLGGWRIGSWSIKLYAT